MIIEFRALATLENPSLFNVNTQEFAKINKTMEAGEIIRINTHFAEEDVEMEINGVISNAFNYIDEDMTFLKLNQGDNLFRYDAESGLDNLVVNIYRQDRYLGV
jgi:ABC-type lipoprotein release transport system permease subunit